MTVVDMKKKSV